jgi:FkbM family methyltransferase
MLWRVLKHIDKGFYIDVGAAWPNDHSVTKAFYNLGWRGANIEPNPLLHQQLQECRTNDINLQLAVGDHEGTLIMNFLAETGLSTLQDDIAHKHQQSGFEVIRQQVHVTTLSKIWKQHIPIGQQVHFLKIDVEGFEEAAIRGNDWQRNRPWVILTEATLPSSQEESYEDWEPILLEAKYQFVYADGLNRYYLAKEHSELLPSFKYPPNVFDGFILNQQLLAEVALNQALTELNDVYASTSWRITAPLRSVGLYARNPAGPFKTQIKTLLQKTASWIYRRPRLKQVTNLDRIDTLVDPQNVSTELVHLSPRARRIYHDLQAEVARQREGQI